MNERLPIVCIFGAEGLSLTSAPTAPAWETTALDCRCFPDDAGLDDILIAHDPHVLVSIGPLARFPWLNAAPFEVRRRWLHFERADDTAEMGQRAFACYLSTCLGSDETFPLVSVFTPTYRTGPRFARPLEAMRAQTYRNWEWVIWDDSDDAGQTHAMLLDATAGDHRIRVLRGPRHSGIIGDVKYNACMQTSGTLLAELDHDDALTPQALEWLVAASRLYPGAGFFYSDFAELNATGGPLQYPDGWGEGFGSYRTEMYLDRAMSVANAPEINPRTIRSLVSCPNHVRAWRRGTYLATGGHNRRLHVADDFDLLIRTFLATRMVRIPRLCYLQYHDGPSTQTVRNADIQRHVRSLRGWYDRAIHQRFAQLGIADWMWDEAQGRSDATRSRPAQTQPASLIAAI